MMCPLFLMLIVNLHLFSEAAIELSNRNMTYHESVSNCTVFGSDQVSDHLRSISVTGISVNVTTSTNYTGHVWIKAKAILSDWLYLWGCFALNQKKRPYKEMYLNETVGDILFECYKFCKKHEFILTNKVCTCSSYTFRSQRLCKAVRCSEQNDIFCGQNDNCLCIYKNLATTNISKYLLDDTYGGNCVIIDKKTESSPDFRNEECQYTYQSMCERIVDKPNSGPYKGSSTKYSWTEAAAYCNRLDDGHTLMRDSRKGISGVLTRSDFPSWTGAFRRVAYSWGIPNDSDELCVSAKITEAQTLEPLITNCSTRLPTLCITKDTSDSHEKDILKTTEYYTYYTYESTVKDSTIKSEHYVTERRQVDVTKGLRVDSYTTEQATISNKGLRIKKSEFQLIYIVYIVVPVVVISLIIMCIVLSVRKRKKRPKRKPGKDSPNGDRDAEHADNALISENNIYSEVRKASHQKESKQHSNSNQPSGVHTESEAKADATYDVFDNKNKSAFLTDNSQYDCMAHIMQEKNDESVYDVASNRNQSNQEQYELSNYDTMANIKGK